MSTSTSGASKFFPKAQEGFSTTTSGTISSGAVTVGLNSTGNYTNGDTVVLIVDPGVSGKEQSFTGVIDTSGVQVTGVVWTSGTNVAHSSGATVVDYVAAAHIDLISSGILVSHNADGTPKTGVTYPASTFQTPTITDFTNADHTHATVAQGGQLTGTAIATGTQLIDKTLNPYKFSVYRNAAANTGNNAFALVTFDTKLYDTGTNYSTATGLFTAPIAGFYQFNWCVGCATATNSLLTSLFKNGADYVRGGGLGVTNFSPFYSTGSALIQLAASDTIGIQAFADVTRAIQVGANPQFTRFEGFLVSAT